MIISVLILKLFILIIILLVNINSKHIEADINLLKLSIKEIAEKTGYSFVHTYNTLNMLEKNKNRLIKTNGNEIEIIRLYFRFKYNQYFIKIRQRDCKFVKLQPLCLVLCFYLIRFDKSFKNSCGFCSCSIVKRVQGNFCLTLDKS